MRNRNFHKSFSLGTLLSLLAMQVLPAYAICACEGPAQSSCCTEEVPQEAIDPVGACCASELEEPQKTLPQPVAHSHRAALIVHSGLVITNHDCDEVVVATDLADAILVVQGCKRIQVDTVLSGLPGLGTAESPSQRVSLDAPRGPPSLPCVPIYVRNASFLI